MSTDYRALCADLLRELEYASAWDYQQALKDRARAALAEPVVAPARPTDEELREVWCEGWNTSEEYGAFKFARAVLARWGHQPAPPAAGEVADERRYLVKELRDQADDLSPSLELFGLIHRAADLLEQRHPAPVPVAERLPGAKDCDGKGQVWVSYERPDWKATIFWELMTMDQAMEWAPVDSWLPATALPLPQGEVKA